MKQMLVILSLAALAACGADGEPEPPVKTGQTGLSVHGTVSVGITG